MTSSPSKNSQVYVAGYTRRTTQEDLEDLFKKFGKIRSIVLKERYAFIQFEDHRDADNVVNEMNGYDFKGRTLVVERSGKKSSRRTKGPQAKDKCFKCGKTGHWANECREQRTRDEERTKRKCNNCGESGHMKKFCPKQRDSSALLFASAFCLSGHKLLSIRNGLDYLVQMNVHRDGRNSDPFIQKGGNQVNRIESVPIRNFKLHRSNYTFDMPENRVRKLYAQLLAARTCGVRLSDMRYFPSRWNSHH